MKNLINEAKRMQQLAGILKENQMSEGHVSAMTPEEVDMFFRKNPGYDQTGDEDVLIDGEQYTKVWYTDNGGRYQYVLMQSKLQSNENLSPNYNELVNAMETALKNYIKNAKGDPNVTLGGQLSTEEGEVVAKLVNLIKQVKQDSKYTIKEDQASEQGYWDTESTLDEIELELKKYNINYSRYPVDIESNTGRIDITISDDSDDVIIGVRDGIVNIDGEKFNLNEDSTLANIINHIMKLLEPQSNEVDQLTEIRQLVRETINEVIKSGVREMWADIKDALANARIVTVDGVEIVKATPGTGTVTGANGKLFRIQTPEYLSKPDRIKIEDANGEMKSPIITLYSDTELDAIEKRVTADQDAERKAWLARYGPGGGYDTPIGFRTFD